MAQMVVAGLTSRGLLVCLQLQRSGKVAFQNDFLPVLRIQCTKKFPRGGGAVAHKAHPPYRFSLNGSPSDSLSSSSDDVLLSSKEFPDGSILFRFGSPGQRISEEAAEVADVCDNGGAHISGSTLAESLPKGEVLESHSRGVSQHQAEAITKGNQAEDTASNSQNATSVQESEVAATGSAPSQDQTNITSSTIATEDSMELRKSAIGREGLKQQVCGLRSGVAMQPHPSKAATGGEDAYLIEGSSWVGVADGVGGWALSGIDAGIFSRELMANCRMLARLEDGVPNPKRVIIESVHKSMAVGTCTAVLAALHKQTLYVANIGDSGFLVVRNREVLARSTPMQRGFNFPLQIGNKSEGDDPSMADTYEVTVVPGDVLVLATDGLYDNLYEREIVEVVQAGLSKAVKPEDVATWLVKLAHSAGIEAHGRSPFSDAARAAGYAYEGGKLDDVTVVISYVE